MDKLHKFIDLYYPIETCNLSCEYCYIHEHRDNIKRKYTCSHSSAEIRRALSVERLGGICLLNFCAGGETLLYPETFDIIEQLLLEGHYVNVVTNGTMTENIHLLEQFDETCRKRLFFKFSFHYGELKKRNLLDVFFSNVQYVKEKGCSFTVELPAWDGFLDLSEEIIGLCQEKLEHQICHVAPLRDETKNDFALLSKLDDLKEYKEKWKVYHSELFDVRIDVMEKKYKGFCYAGDWTFTVNLENGEVKQCFYERVLDNLYQNIEQKIKLCAVGNHCHSSYCYACHAFLCLGVMPDANVKICYDEVRDREGKWLSYGMKHFLHQKLCKNNSEYTIIEKENVNEQNAKAERSLYQSPFEYSNQIIIEMKDLPKVNNYAVVRARHETRLMYSQVPRELKWIYNEIPEDKCLNGDRIIIRAMNTANEMADGNEIWIVGALIDDVWYAAECLFDSTWLCKMRMIGWNSYTENLPDNVWGIIPKGEHITLVFEKNRWRGKLEVEYKNQIKEIDTFSPCDNDLMYYDLEE